MVFLRTTLVNNLDEQLAQQAAGSIANSIFTTASVDGQTVFSQVDNAPQIGSMVVVYGPDGQREAFYNGTASTSLPDIPQTFTLEQTYLQIDKRIELEDPTSGQHFLARVGVLQPQGNPGVYTQMVIQPLAPTDRIAAAYLGIYAFVALLILIATALLTRLLVTLAFRNLRQVETTAMDIAAGDFSQRLTDIVPDTEVGRLKTAINAMLARIDGAIGQRDATVRQMRRFIGDASHELRTPLVTMRGYAELYRMGAITGEEDTARAMERIEKEAIRMGVLVEDLLALARLDEEREPEIEPLDLRPIARDAALDLRAAAPARTVTVVDRTVEAPLIDVTTRSTPVTAPPPPAPRGLSRGTLARLRRRPRAASVEVPGIDFTEAADIPVRTPPIVLGEENKVRQVITNLLGNARRFSPEESPIELIVDADRVRGTGSISIVDHGEGIPPQIREQIFERFWRADTSRARETGGSGLGLAIVSSIVKALHGSVTVSETPGGGATFTVTLPLAPSRATPAHLLEDTQPLEPLDL